MAEKEPIERIWDIDPAINFHTYLSTGMGPDGQQVVVVRAILDGKEISKGRGPTQEAALAEVHGKLPNHCVREFPKVSAT